MPGRGAAPFFLLLLKNREKEQEHQRKKENQQKPRKRTTGQTYGNVRLQRGRGSFQERRKQVFGGGRTDDATVGKHVGNVSIVRSVGASEVVVVGWESGAL